MVAALTCALVAMSAARADHVSDGDYPYVAEITIELLAQEKLYGADPGRALTWREKTTTRIVLYKFWGSSLLSSFNDPEEGGPHGPLRDVGLLVHEAGVNRVGTSTLRLSSKAGEPVLEIEQDTELKQSNGDTRPDVKLSAALEARLWKGALADFADRERVTMDLTDRGKAALLAALQTMLSDLYARERERLTDELKTNGLAMEPDSLQMRAEFIGTREFKAVFDNNAGLARVRLPDMRIRIRALVEQTYE